MTSLGVISLVGSVGYSERSPIRVEERTIAALAAFEHIVVPDKHALTTAQAAIGSGIVHDVSRCRAHGDLRVDPSISHPWKGNVPGVRCFRGERAAHRRCADAPSCEGCNRSAADRTTFRHAEAAPLPPTCALLRGAVGTLGPATAPPSQSGPRPHKGGKVKKGWCSGCSARSATSCTSSRRGGWLRRCRGCRRHRSRCPRPSRRRARRICAQGRSPSPCRP